MPFRRSGGVEADALGIRISAVGGALRVAPASRLPAELRVRLVADKPAVLAELAANDATAGTPAPAADLARGRRLLARLHWTGRRIEIAPDGAPDDATHRAVPDAEPDDDVDLRLGRDDAGARVVLTAAVVYRDAGELRRLAARLHDVADALEGSGS